MQRHCYVLKLQSKSELRTKLFDIYKTVNSLTLNIKKKWKTKITSNLSERKESGY